MPTVTERFRDPRLADTSKLPARLNSYTREFRVEHVLHCYGVGESYTLQTG